MEKQEIKKAMQKYVKAFNKKLGDGKVAGTLRASQKQLDLNTMTINFGFIVIPDYAKEHYRYTAEDNIAWRNAMSQDKDFADLLATFNGHWTFEDKVEPSNKDYTIGYIRITF